MKNLYFALLLLVACAGCDTPRSTTEQTLAAEPAIPVDSLKAVLAEVHKTDQGIREKFNGVTSPEEQQELIHEMNRIDSTNQVTVKAILDKYGWLPLSKVGSDAATTLFLVVQHSNVPMMKTYLPQLKEQAEKAEAKRTHVAMMEDRLLMFQNKKQLYGTQATGMTNPDGKMEIWPIEDAANVNARRQKAGFLNTVEEYADTMGAIYNPDVELPENKFNF